MQPSSDSAFDFQQWAALAKADPAAFEARRVQAIDELIADAAPQNQTRLRGLQWQIDMVRGRASNPLSGCVQIFNRMWNSLYGERGLLEALHAVDGPALSQRSCGELVELQLSHSTPRHHKIIRPSSQP